MSWLKQQASQLVPQEVSSVADRVTDFTEGIANSHALEGMDVRTGTHGAGQHALDALDDGWTPPGAR